MRENEKPQLPIPGQEDFANIRYEVGDKVRLTDNTIGIINKVKTRSGLRLFEIRPLDKNGQPIEGKTLSASVAHLAEKLGN